MERERPQVGVAYFGEVEAPRASSPSLFRRGKSFLERLGAAEKRDNAHLDRLEHRQALQTAANALFKRTLPQHVAKQQQHELQPEPATFSAEPAPPRLRPPRPLHEVSRRLFDDDGTDGTSTPLASERPRSPMRRAAAHIHRRAATTVRTARRAGGVLISPGRARNTSPPRGFGSAATVRRASPPQLLPTGYPKPATGRRLTKRTGPQGGGGGIKKRKGKAAKPSATSTDPSRDCVQHGYAPLGPIAAGAFSTIRHARVVPGHARLAPGLEVAIKTWSVASCKKDMHNAVDRDNELGTLRRAGTAATRPHPHIANLLDIVNGPTYTHGVMEYCAGGSLLRHLQRLQTQKAAGTARTARTAGGKVPSQSGMSSPQGAMEPAQAQWVSQQVASGLAFLHSLGIAHRDVKPANVLFYDASRTSVKLCDFGFAVFCADRKLRVRCGTPIYNAPELVAGREYLGPPVDVWALGAMVFEMLHGMKKPAFSGNSIGQVEGRIRTCSHQPFDAATDSDARAFVSACLITHPGQRLTAAAGLAHPWLAGVVQPPPQPVLDDGSSGGGLIGTLHAKKAADAQAEATIQVTYHSRVGSRGKLAPVEKKPVLGRTVV